MTHSYLRIAPTNSSAKRVTAPIVALMVALFVAPSTGCVSQYRVNSDELTRAKSERRAHYFVAGEDSDGDTTYIQSSKIRNDVVDLGDDTSAVTMRGPALGLWIGGGLATAAGIAVLSTASYDYDTTIYGSEDTLRNLATISGGITLVAGGLTMLIINAVLMKRFDDEPSDGFSEDVGPLEEP
ncbi:MAG: hypothetical protein ACI9OJ_006066 [Myxococcota bacterium]|jgi:hypothetical protein